MTNLQKATLRGQKRAQKLAKQGSVRQALRISKEATSEGAPCRACEGERYLSNPLRTCPYCRGR